MNNMNIKQSAIALSFALGLSACSGEPPATTMHSKPVEQMEASPIVATKDIQSTARRIGNSVANWQIAQFGNLTYIPESHREKSENAKF